MSNVVEYGALALFVILCMAINWYQQKKGKVQREHLEFHDDPIIYNPGYSNIDVNLFHKE